jgi:S-DNA-T family DNA segregation ATPase FtsK/SpoIIIE
MNAIVPGPAFTGKANKQAEMVLVGTVALARVRAAMDAHPNTKSLFCIVGLDNELTCATASRIAKEMANGFVRVHYELNDGTLPEDLLTDRNTTDFRNMPRSAGGGCIVFATPTRDRDIVGATAGEITPLSFDTLARDPSLWIDACPELSTLKDRERNDLTNFLMALHQSGIVVGGLLMLAGFILELEANFRGKSLARAIDESLPAIRICRNAGRFKETAQKGRVRSKAKWTETILELHKVTSDAVNLVNERGFELDRDQLRQQIDRQHASGRLDEDQARVLRDLVDDVKIEPGVEWRPTQEAVVRLPWDKVEPAFKAPKRTQRLNLGEETLAYFDNSNPTLLTKEERQLLETVSSEENEPEDEEKEFFFSRRDEIAEDKRLLKRWESYVFRTSSEHSDLLVGLLTTVSDLILDVDSLPMAPRVFVRLVGAEKLSYWKNKNTELASYLRDRYRGLDRVLAEVGVKLDFGQMWSKSWAENMPSAIKTGTTARQFKIEVFLLNDGDFEADGGPKPAVLKSAPSRQFVWSMSANCLGASYSANLTDIAAAAERQPLPIGRFSRAQRSERVIEEGIDLENRGSIQDVHGEPDGLLVDTNDPTLDAAILFEKGMARVSAFIAEPVQNRLLEAFKAFRAAYVTSVVAMMSGEGLGSPTLLEQAQLYGAFLDCLRHDARKDDCRKLLWEPIMLVGAALSEDRPEVAIVTPWHPFRLAEAAVKARRIAAAIGKMLGSSGSSGASLRRFAHGVAEGVAAPWHPSIIVHTDGPAHHLFIETDTSFEFSLLETPTAGEGGDLAFDGYSREAASELISMANEYLALQPHERANFSISLFNADNRELPSRLAERLARKIETESDLRCDLILTHTDQQRLRQIYAEQNVAISRELDGALSGEAAKMFLSRLRVGFLDADAVTQTTEGRSRVDIVFLHDVIARSAKISWRRVDGAVETFADFCRLDGEASSRKRPFELGARKTEVFLVPNERPSEVQSYLDLLHDLHQDEQDDQGFNFAPVREIVFDDANVGKILEKAHKVGNWVVTFDAIADRQLLLNNDVNVIRFLPKPGLRHNVIVSTNRHGRTLTTRLEEILGSIADLDPRDQSALAKVFIDQAARISGKIVLHAARNEQNALELVGLVLSCHVVNGSLGYLKPVAWLLIDDFLEWLAHPPGKRADILVVALSEIEGVPIVDLVVVESKFVSISGETQEAKDAMLQLKATTDYLRDNLVLNKDPLNRPTWLSRLADLIAEQATFDGEIAGRDAVNWANTLRSNSAVLRIRGVALVFTHDRREGTAEPFQSASSEQQEYLFDRHLILSILNAIRAGERPIS